MEAVRAKPSRFRAALFDFGGTLYDYECLESGGRECMETLARRAGIAAETSEVHRAYREAIRREYRSYLERSYYLHANFFRDALLAMGESFGTTIRPEDLEWHRAEQWRLHERDFALREGVPETLRALRARGLHLGIVSNIDEDQLLHLGRLAGLDSYFDSILSSERAGSCKPDSGIFREALRRAGCEPSEALFVGDSLEHDVAGAKRAGLVAVHLWHRPARPRSQGSAEPDHVIATIPEILDLL